MTQTTQITDAMLFRFFAGQLTEEETSLLKAWMDENPEEHQKVMKKAHDIYVLGGPFCLTYWLWSYIVFSQKRKQHLGPMECMVEKPEFGSLSKSCITSYVQ